jgi:hypothetical protein
MPFRIAAAFILLLHAGFILYVVLGGLLIFRDGRWAVAHLPAAVWGMLIELTGWICPLTPLENALRRLGGQEPYSGDWIDHYVMPLIYPPGLTRNFQIAIALIVLALNIVIYGYYTYRRSKRPG